MGRIPSVEGHESTEGILDQGSNMETLPEQHWPTSLPHRLWTWGCNSYGLKAFTAPKFTRGHPDLWHVALTGGSLEDNQVPRAKSSRRSVKPLSKGAWESAPAPDTTRRHSRKSASLWLGRGPSLDWPHWHLDPALPASRTMGSKILLLISYAVCGILLQRL